MGSGVSLGRKTIRREASNSTAVVVATEPHDSPRSAVSDLHEAMSPAQSPNFLPYAMPRVFSGSSNGTNLRSLESSPGPGSGHSRARSTPSRMQTIDSDQQQGAAELFAHTALSLGMDNDDLLFNMMFFDDGSGGTFGHIMNTVQQETLALHSEHNTPYKLNPASAEAVGGLLKEAYRPQQLQQLDEEEDGCRECAVCREDMEEGCSILRIPTCKHFFHEDCILKWSSLQGWCPVCRTPFEHQIHPQAKADIQALTADVSPI